MLRQLLDRLNKRASALAARVEDSDPLQEAEQRLDEVDVAGAKEALERVSRTSTSGSRVDIVHARLAMMEQRYDEADTLLAEVLLYEPRNAEGLAWMAALKMCRHQPEEAIPFAERAYRLGYNRAWLHEMSGVAHFAANRFEQAAAAWTAALSLEPDRSVSRNNLIQVLGKLNRWPELEQHLIRAMAEDGERATLLAYLGNSLVSLGRENEAWPVFERASARDDADATVLFNQGVALFDSGQIEPARRALERAASLDPSDDRFPVMLSDIELIEHGSTRRNWEAYERRYGLRPDDYRVRSAPWHGERLADDQVLLVYAEQGMGDVLLFSRWLPAIARLAGCRVHFGVHPPLERLFRQTSETLPEWRNISVSGVSRPPELQYTAELPLLSLLARVDLPIERVLSPYVTTSRDLDKHWAERLPRSARRRVGLMWAGNPHRKDDAIRSIPTAQLEALGDQALLERIEFVNLQMDDRPDCRSSLLPFPLIEIRADIKDFADTAAIIRQLDLVVAIDGGVAHIAGAVGTPCWVLLSRIPNWRWSMNGIEQPWYGQHRSLRATKNRDWTDVLLQLKADLIQWAETK
jgi:tetratricopeptide (TPR) repeat protein